MADQPQDRYVPARYIGGDQMRLRPHPPIPGGVYRDAEGRPRDGDDALILKPGETLMIPESELRGQTFLIDPSGLSGSTVWLGAGTVLLPEHTGLQRDDLIGVRFVRDGLTRQYEFHDGRADFQDAAAPWPSVTVEAAPAAPAAPAAAPTEAAPTRKSGKATPETTTAPASETASA